MVLVINRWFMRILNDKKIVFGNFMTVFAATQEMVNCSTDLRAVTGSSTLAGRREWRPQRRRACRG